MITNADKETYIHTVGELMEYLKGLPEETRIRAGHFSELKIADDGNGTFVIN